MKKFNCFVTENGEFSIIQINSKSREKCLNQLKHTKKHNHLTLTYDRYEYYKVEKEEFKNTHYHKFNEDQRKIISKVMFNE